jgi:hypothetical protein
LFFFVPFCSFSFLFFLFVLFHPFFVPFCPFLFLFVPVRQDQNLLTVR